MIKPDTIGDKPEYSVYWWDKDGHQHTEMQWQMTLKCMQAVKRLTQGPASVLGFVKRVIITDGGDSIVFEWKLGEGITWPTKEQMEEHRRGKA
ncbi:MAG TPA: hypothetical protein VLG09_05850 [Candidatus Saccharimonadales bacterium]|nr:hypothetical protein [Candidatus Saccharimonadales bacterium]